jgi:ankyrin repeat protein
MSETDEIDETEQFPRTPLMRAAERGDAAEVAQRIAQGDDIYQRKFLGECEVNALDLAIDGGYEDIVRLLLDAGAWPSDRESSLDDTPLMRAARRGHVGIIRLLVERGADMDEHEFAGNRPLMLAALFGHREAVEMLLELGAELECEARDGYTALLHAIHGAHPEIIRLLVERGAQINRHDKHGFTYLMHPLTGPYFRRLYKARRPGDPRPAHPAIVPRWDVETVRVLLSLGADVHLRGNGRNEGKTVLMQAALEGQEAIAKLFLAAGADLYARDVQGRTALTWALLYGKKKMTVLLRKQGIQPSLFDAALLGDVEEARRLLDEQLGQAEGVPEEPVLWIDRPRYDPTEPPLIWAVLADNRVAIETLINAGAHIEVRNAQGKTPLMLAVRSSSPKRIERLLAFGADPNAMDNDGATVLMQDDSSTSARPLLAGGADPNLAHRGDGTTPLMYAAAKGAVAMLDVLLAAGANVSATDNEGRTALHHACTRDGDPRAVRALLAAGADPDALDKHGAKPADYARVAGRPNIIKAIR